MGVAQGTERQEQIKWLQTPPNALLPLHLEVNGAYDEATREQQQQQHGLQPDGVAGPITNAKIRALIGEGAGV